MRVNRSDVDHRTTGATLEHETGHLTIDQKRAGQVHGKDSIPEPELEFVHEPTPDDSRRVHDDVNGRPGLRE
ncbi:hypothetical protein NLS1_00930 [Nocardioides sp. LS1]|nr:hypothetical protein NLS1_00930 [Nocardioides sp. LS1]